MNKVFIVALIVLALTAGGIVLWETNYLQKFTIPTQKKTTPTPEQVTETFYTWYIKCLEGKTKDKSCQWEKNEYVSDKITKNIKGNGYNPIICAQNVPDTSKGSVVVKKAEILDDKARATVYSLYSWENRPIDVELEQINNQWKIIGLACPLHI